jgi:hypothetical protein
MNQVRNCAIGIHEADRSGTRTIVLTAQVPPSPRPTARRQTRSARPRARVPSARPLIRHNGRQSRRSCRCRCRARTKYASQVSRVAARLGCRRMSDCLHSPRDPIVPLPLTKLIREPLDPLARHGPRAHKRCDGLRSLAARSACRSRDIPQWRAPTRTSSARSVKPAVRSLSCDKEIVPIETLVPAAAAPSEIAKKIRKNGVHAETRGNADNRATPTTRASRSSRKFSSSAQTAFPHRGPSSGGVRNH